MSAIRFAHDNHADFYSRMMKKSKRQDDPYHKALFYLFGVSSETRNHINELFDFDNSCIEPEALNAGWQTGSTLRLTRFAFNLWNGWTEKSRPSLSTPYELFDCGFAPYFWEAIKLRYPEYCCRLFLNCNSCRGA